MAQKLKILAISYLYPNSQYPDYGIFVHNRLKAVSRYCDVCVINPIPWFPFSNLLKRYKSFDQISKKERIDGIKIYHPKFFIIPRLLKFIDAFTFSFAVFSVVFKLHKQNAFDLIDLHWTYPDLLSGFLLSRFLKKHYLVTVRGKEALNVFVQEKKAKYAMENSLRAAMTTSLLKRSSAVITLSRELKNICADSGVGEKKITVITNGIDKSSFFYIPQYKARQKLGLDTDAVIILGVGALTFGKGFDRLLNLLPDLQKKYPKTNIYIIGSEGSAGAYKKQLTTLCLKNEITDSVHFLGQIPNNKLFLWYNAADLFCLCSRSEGSPNVLYEALACGCPCVATDVGSVCEILNSDGFGTIVENDGAALYGGICSALAQLYERESIADYMQQHDWDACAKKVINVYEIVVSSKT